MTRDQKMTKREQIKKSKKQDELARNRKSHKDSDDDGGDNDDEYDYDEEEDEMDVHEYRKFLAKMFTSKNMDKKIKMGDKIKKFMKTLPPLEDDEEDDEGMRLYDSFYETALKSDIPRVVINDLVRNELVVVTRK